MSSGENAGAGVSVTAQGTCDMWTGLLQLQHSVCSSGDSDATTDKTRLLWQVLSTQTANSSFRTQAFTVSNLVSDVYFLWHTRMVP